MSHRCRATNRAGQPCGQLIDDAEVVCKFHGGSAPAVIAAAERRRAQMRAQQVLAQLGQVEPCTDAVAACEELLGRQMMLVRVLGEVVSTLREIAYEAPAGEQLRAELGAYQVSLRDAERAASRMLALDLAERRTRVAEQQADLLEAALLVALHDPAVGLGPRQIERAREVLVLELTKAQELTP